MVEEVLANTPMESFSIFVEDDGLGDMGLPPLFLAEEARVDDKTYFLESVTGDLLSSRLILAVKCLASLILPLRLYL